MNRYCLTGLVMAWCLALTGAAQAVNVVEADFNDLSAGLLHGQYGGSGWAPNPDPPGVPNYWNEPELIGNTQLIAGDLVAPASTNYAVAQGAGTPLHANEGGLDFGTPGRFIEPILSGSPDSESPEDWWFSFLFRLDDSQSRAGIVVDYYHRILATGGPGDGSPGPTQVFTEGEGSTGHREDVPFTLGADHLMIGQVIDEGGADLTLPSTHRADLLKIWVDPDVDNFPINSPDAQFDDRDYDEHPSGDPDSAAPGIAKVSISLYALNNQFSTGGHLDQLRISDASNAMNVILFGDAPAGPGLDGDYNGNDILDAADYSVWRDAMTAGSTSLLNDPTPGTVDESDFLYWRAHFGEASGSGAGTVLTGTVVPEPGSGLLAAICLWLVAPLSRRRPASGRW